MYYVGIDHIQPSQRNINPDKMDVKDNQKSHLVGRND